MEQEREKLQREIDLTTQSLLDKVSAAAEGVQEKAEAIRESVEKLSLRHQMEERPGTILAASVGAGVLAGWKLAGRRGTRWVAPALRTGLKSQAAGFLVPLAVGIGVRVFGDWAKKKYPKSATYVDILQSTFPPGP